MTLSEAGMDAAPLFDTHAHYDDEAFDGDRDELLKRLAGRPERPFRVINAGSDMASSERSLALAERYPFVWAACGVHPGAAGEAVDFERLAKLLRHPKCVAVGEIGLDYHYDTPSRETQWEAARLQMEVAEQTGKPVVLHDREAHEDALKLIGLFPSVRGVFHCFSGSVEMARLLVQKGWYLGFGGVLTYPNARKAREAAAAVPKERILLETDAPYLPPQGHRGQRCDSSMMEITAAALAGIWGKSIEYTLAQCAGNGEDLYGLEKNRL